MPACFVFLAAVLGVCTAFVPVPVAHSVKESNRRCAPVMSENGMASRAQFTRLLAGSATLLVSQGPAYASLFAQEVEDEKLIKKEVEEIAELDREINAEVALELKDEIKLNKLRTEYSNALKAGDTGKADAIRQQATALAAAEAEEKSKIAVLVQQEAEDVAILKAEVADLKSVKAKIDQSEDVARIQSEEANLEQLVGDDAFGSIKKFFKF